MRRVRLSATVTVLVLRSTAPGTPMPTALASAQPGTARMRVSSLAMRSAPVATP